MVDGEFKTRGKIQESNRREEPSDHPHSFTEMANWNGFHSGFDRILFEHEFLRRSLPQSRTN